MEPTELFQHCQAKLRPYFASRLPNTADVDDCVSEVVARALEGLRKGHQPDVLPAWLFGIARNVLKERYEAARRAGGDLPDEVPVVEDDVPVEPSLPSELEYLMGKRELWDMLDAAASGLGEGLQHIMRTHITLTVQSGKLVVGKDLARALDVPASRVDRQLDRARKAMLKAIGSLVVARTGRCAELVSLVPSGRKAVLSPDESAAVLKHSGTCPVCAPSASEARAYSRWALGPGLLGLVQDDEERRRMLLALASRGGEGTGHGSSASVVAGGGVAGDELAGLGERIGVGDLAGTDPAGTAARDGQADADERARTGDLAGGEAVAHASSTASASGGLMDRLRTAMVNPRLQSVAQFASENPEVVRRVATAVIGGGVVVAAVIAVIAAGSGDSTHADTTTPVTTTTTTAAAAPGTSSVPGAPPLPAATTTSTTTRPAGPPNPGTPADPGTPAPSAASKSPIAPDTTTSQQPPPTTSNPPDQRSGEITVDATALSYTGFSLSGIPGTHTTKQPLRTPLRPGGHTLTAPGGTPIPFEVTPAGKIAYDRAHDTVLSGRDSSTLVVRGARVTVDVTDLSYANTSVTGIGWPAPQAVRTLNLLPGKHAVVSLAGQQVAFQITQAGTLQHNSPLLSGDPTRLVVRGLPMTLDSTDVDYYNMSVSGTGWLAPQKVRTYRLLPGTHAVHTPAGNQVAFRFTDAGTVEYTSAHLGGTGTRTLVLRGVRMTLNATGVDYYNVTVTGVGWPAPQKVRQFRLLPGAHFVHTPAGNQVAFRLTEARTVEYTSPHLGGSGTATLSLRGVPMTLDSTGVDYYNVTVTGVGWPAPQKVRQFRLLPGAHFVHTPAGNQVAFRLTEAGTVTYESPLLSGTGTATLAVRGLTMTLDSTNVDYYNVTVTGVGWPSPQKVRQFRLLPGAHFVHTVAGNQVAFRLTDRGTVEYDSPLLAGEGTPTLAVRGLTMTLDSTGVDYYNVTVTGAGWPAPQKVRQFRLLPGAHAVHTVAGNQVAFRLTEAGTVTYESPLLSGTGTATLTVRGLPVTLDSTNIDYSSATVTGAGWPAPQKVRVFRLLPGKHAVHTTAGNKLDFEVSATGSVSYANDARGLFEGASTARLTVRGLTVTVKATGPWFSVAGLAARSALQPQDLRLLPGAHVLLLSDGRKLPFTVDRAGHVGYDPSLDTVLEGRGTSTLTVR